jgi:hypothetical protein
MEQEYRRNSRRALVDMALHGLAHHPWVQAALVQLQLMELIEERRMLAEARETLKWKQLGPRFGTVDANIVNSTMLDEYVEHRTLQGVIKSTRNRELATLRHLLRIGAQATPPIVRWDAIPRFELADESDLIRTDVLRGRHLGAAPERAGAASPAAVHRGLLARAEWRVAEHAMVTSRSQAWHRASEGRQHEE